MGETITNRTGAGNSAPAYIMNENLIIDFWDSVERKPVRVSIKDLKNYINGDKVKPKEKPEPKKKPGRPPKEKEEK